MKKMIMILGLFAFYDCHAQYDLKTNGKPLKKANNAVIDNLVIKRLYDFSTIKDCREMPPPTSPLPPMAASNSYTMYNIDVNGNVSNVAYQRQPLAAYNNYMWVPGETIKVGFDITGVSINTILKVQFYAREWERIANIKFDFVLNINDAAIRVGFVPGWSYSWIGREALVNPSKYLTMNFGWLATTANEDNFRQVVLHEFGHALGFIHEHQSPGASIPWDKEKVYAYYALPPNNWSRDMVDKNIFTKYSVTTTNYSSYDRLSIMHYDIPAELTTDGSGTPYNTNFSAMDRQYTALMYPFPPLPPNVNGTLRTGDDCDEVDFLIEYGVVPEDKVEFKMEYGQTGNKRVTWWKQIAIPNNNNRETVLYILNNSLIASENKTMAVTQIPFVELNKNKAIAFWKAKAFGVHTLLNYQWNILKAIRGGCRISLVWKKDSCP
jgi:hypothetical protein